MSDFQMSDYILQTECDQLAQDIFDEIMAENPGEEPEQLRDEMQDRTHETADGHEWVIYNYKALMICAHCNTDNGEDFLTDTGLPSEPDIYKLACVTAYGEMRARIEAKISELIDDWESADEAA